MGYVDEGSGVVKDETLDDIRGLVIESFPKDLMAGVRVSVMNVEVRDNEA